MSLVAWYPLNGDTLDYSGNSVLASASSVAYSDFGKIGRCLTTGSVRLPIGVLKGKKESLSFWYYNTEEAVSKTGVHQITGGDIRRYCLYSYPNNNDLHYSFYDDAKKINSISGVIVGVLPPQTWVNITFVNDSLDFSIYINGDLVRKFSDKTWVRDFTDSEYDLVHNSSYHKINDIRIYDHALSLKEIKEIAKAKILHYTFDESEEPTVNYGGAHNPRVDESYAPFVATTSGTWADKHPGAIRVYNINGSEISSYCNSGVADWTNTYHAIWELDQELNKPVVVMRDLDGAWKSKTFALGKSMGELGLKYGDKYAISWLQWTDSLAKSANAGLYGKNLSGVRSFYDGQSNKDASSYNSKLSTWQRVSSVFTVSESRDLADPVSIYMYGYHGGRGTVRISDVQIEIKDHATEFTPTARNGKVLDTSGYENHAPLDPITTPAWIKESRIGDGAYRFNGLNNVIHTDSDSNPTKEITLYAWVKPADVPATSDRAIIIQKLGNFYLTVKPDRTVSSYWYGTVPAGYHDTSEKLEPNKWSQIASVWDGEFVNLYINGRLSKRIAVKTPGITTSAKITIGCEYGHARYFKGDIDDIRVYASALSTKDIKELYESKANVDNQGKLACSSIVEHPTKRFNLSRDSRATKHIHIFAKKYPTDSQAPVAGIYVDRVLAHQYSRDWHISVWDPAKESWAIGIDFKGATSVAGAHARYDVYNSATRVAQRKAFVDTLSSIGSEYIVIIAGSHAPEFYDTGMVNAIVEYGGSKKKLKWSTRQSYICVGRKGYGEGNAISEVLSNLNPADNSGSEWARTDVHLEKEKTELLNNGIFETRSVNEIGLPIRYIRESMNGSTANSGNHWVEIEAYDDSERNIALGKTANHVLLTDGSIATSPWASPTPNATVDLGSVHKVSYLKIWHYYGDKRTYHNIKTEVSTNETDWITVFDSTRDGEYAESDQGKIIILKPDKMVMDGKGNLYVKEIKEVTF